MRFRLVIRKSILTLSWIRGYVGWYFLRVDDLVSQIRETFGDGVKRWKCKRLPAKRSIC